MKLFAFLACMAGTAVGQTIIYGVNGGSQNTVEGDYAVVNGGLNNVAGQSYSAVAGGNKNKVYARYGSAVGGSNNRAFGKFSATAGSSMGLVNGRKSLIMGYNATNKGDHSAVFSFNGESCDVGNDNTIKFCSDDLQINGVSLKSLYSRRLEMDMEAVKLDIVEAQVQAKEAELAKFEKQMYAILAEREELIAANAALIASKKL
jgi:hypothetical protein